MIGDKKANDGLHLSSEHIVITRDQPDPVKIGAMARAKYGKELEKEERKEPQAWEVLTEEDEESPQKTVDSPNMLKKDLARKSPPKKLNSNLDKFALKEFTATKSSGSNMKGSQIGGVW